MASPAATSSLSSESHSGSRITIPRLKSSSALRENIIDSKPQTETKKRPAKTNKKKENPDTKEKRPKEKRPKQKKVNKEKEKSRRPRPPLAAGCFSVCDTLIFEVYQLLGGSVCDC